MNTWPVRMEIPIQALRVGDVGIGGVPTEVFVEIGLELKRAGYLDRIAAGIVLTGGSAQLRGLAPASLYWWRSQLRRRGARQREGLQLARVTVVDAKTSGTRPSDGFEVLLGNGRRLLVPRDLDAVTLRHLIATLER